MSISPRAALLLRAAVFLAAALPITVIDLRSRRIPDALSLGGLGLLATVDIAAASPDLPLEAAAALFAFLLFYLVRRVTGGLGFGDVKYAALLGFFAGPRLLPLVFFTAAAGGLIYAFVAARFLKRARDERVAFGPFLSAGGFAAALCMALGFSG